MGKTEDKLSQNQNVHSFIRSFTHSAKFCCEPTMSRNYSDGNPLHTNYSILNAYYITGMVLHFIKLSQ